MVESSREFKDALYEQFARIGKAVSSPKRLELLDLLCQGERTVEVLAREAELSVANASQHLQVLRSAGLVCARKSGLFVVCRIADSETCDFVRAIKRLARHRLPEIERVVAEFRGADGDLEPGDRYVLAGTEDAEACLE